MQRQQTGGNTPVPPFHGLRFHIVFPRSPACQGIPGSRGLILEVILEDHARLLSGYFAVVVVFIQDVGIVDIASFVVSQDGAVVGEGVVKVVFFGLGQ